MRLIVSVLVVTFLCMFRQGNSVQLKNFLINREAVITRSDDECKITSNFKYFRNKFYKFYAFYIKGKDVQTLLSLLTAPGLKHVFPYSSSAME